MKVHPYLNFDGNAEEAFIFYKSVFGGEFMANMKMSECPTAISLGKGIKTVRCILLCPLVTTRC
jgi:PhnB protein